MNYNKRELDCRLCTIMRAMWMYLTFSAFCVLCTVCAMYLDPDLALGMYHRIPRMIECLLAGCAVTVGFGAAFQYLGGR